MKYLFAFVLFAFFAPLLTAQHGHCVSGNCLDGKGKFRFADGATYEGDFRKGKFTGRGVMHYPDGALYAGNWRFSLQQGKGRMEAADGTVYFGMWHNGRRHGEGEVIFPDQSRVRATFTNGHIAGAVEYKYANGDFYRGQLKGYIPHGEGVMQYVSGDEYEGQWAEGQRHGEGRIVFEDGTELRGRWEKDQFRTDWSGLGFQGNREGVPDCNRGCPDGQGKYAYPNGTIFYGEVAGGFPVGSGTVLYPDGNIYHGDFSGHRPDGLGVMHYADGEIHGGIWRSGANYRRLYEAVGRPARSVAAVSYDPAVKVWAVVVGAARYTHLRSLRYTDDDAYQLFAFLKSVEGGALPDEQVRVLIDDDATHRNIVMTMREVYQRADENDVVLFYFSGHGIPGAFLPVDYDGILNRLEHDEIKDELLASRAKHKLVIADACHSGSLGGRDNQGAVAISGRSGSVDAALNAYYAALNNADASTALLLSSKGEEISLEDGGLRSGIFSHYLIEGMRGKADSDGDRLVSIQELYAYVHREVRRYTDNIQTPTLTGTYDNLMPVSVIRR